jgi:DNA-binding MarR family transcriptional regulator
METSARQGPGIAFLLAQLGSLAAERFSRAVADHGLTPPLVGVLRLLMSEPSLSQQQLADRLGAVPSRIVGYVDDLEERGWVVRTRGTRDRRVNTLQVTEAGRAGFRGIAEVAREHERRVTEGLSDGERAELLALLTRLAGLRELTPGVHPGYGWREG